MKINSSHKRFLIALAASVSILLLLGFIFDKEASLRWMNQFQCMALDLFFQFFTLFGNGYFIIAVSIIWLFVRKFQWKIPLTNVLLYAISGLLAQLFKRTFNSPRPKKFFGDQFETLAHPMWVNFGSHNSFPSGHTTSAFAMLVFFALLSKSDKIRYILLGVAILAGLSRVYLLQHFMIDVAAGAILGSICALVTVRIIKEEWI